MSNCLVLIDIQNGFINKWTKNIPNKVEQLVEERKEQFNHIVGTQFINDPESPFVRILKWKKMIDEHSIQVCESVRDSSEKVFIKNIYSCFTPEFDDYIIKSRIDKLYFAGIDTDACVLKSVIDAFERGIEVELLLNYCASTGGSQSHNAARMVLERIIGSERINTKW